MIKKNAADLQHTFFQILVAMLMVFVLLICAASPSHAVVGVTSILIPSVIAALESWGISTAADGLDGAAIAEWFHDKLTDWSTYAGIALENIVTGIKMTPLGQVLLNPFALAGIREFGAWLVQQEGLVAGGSSVPVIQPSSDGAQLLTPDVMFTIGNVPGGSTYAVKVDTADISTFVVFNGTAYYYFCASSPRRITVYWYRNGSLLSNESLSLTATSVAGCAAAVAWTGPAPHSWNSIVPMYSSAAEGYAAYVGGSSADSGSLELVPSLEMDVPTAADVQDKEMLLNTSLDVGADAAAWYEQVMNKVAANDLTATGTLVGAGTITADQVIPQEGITDVDGTVSWPEVTSPIGVSGLDEIFPFCIPFDVYHFFQALAADPVAPSFEIPFVIPNIVDYTFELDLSDFDQVAQILRTVELLAFCVGLAFVTRSFFIRG